MAYRAVEANHKGGASKTSGVMGLAAALASLGYRVRAVDMDPQANLTRRLGYDEELLLDRETLAEILERKRATAGAARDIILPCGWDHPLAERITLIPARLDLEDRAEETGNAAAAYRLRTVLEGADDDVDFVLIDTPPNLGHLTQMALAAGDGVIVPVIPEHDAVKGAVRIKHHIEANRQFINRPDLEIIGVTVNNVRHTGGHQAHIAHLATLFPAELIWTPHIPQRAVLADSNDAAIPLVALGGRANEIAQIYVEHAKLLVKVATGRPA